MRGVSFSLWLCILLMKCVSECCHCCYCCCCWCKMCLHLARFIFYVWFVCVCVCVSMMSPIVIVNSNKSKINTVRIQCSWFFFLFLFHPETIKFFSIVLFLSFIHSVFIWILWTVNSNSPIHPIIFVQRLAK